MVVNSVQILHKGKIWQTTVHATIPERIFALDDHVWAGITRLLITALDAERSINARSGIVAYTVVVVGGGPYFPDRTI